MNNLIDRLHAYSADATLRPDYAATMIEAADALIGMASYKTMYESLSALLDLHQADARRFVFMAKSLFADKKELDKLAEAGVRTGQKIEPTNIEEFRVTLDAVQAEYEKG